MIDDAPIIPAVGAVANWFGSNRMLAKEAGDAVGKVSWLGVPFAGGMCELPYMRARTILVNDTHEGVINLARVMADPIAGAKLIRRLRRCVYHEAQFRESQDFCREESEKGGVMFYTGTKSEDRDEAWAFHYFISSWMARAGDSGTDREFKAGMSIRWEGSGGDSAKRFFNATNGIREWRQTLRRCQFLSMDFQDFLAKCKDEQGHALYCDPPWVELGEKYASKFTLQQQETLAKLLSAYKLTRVVVRFGDHPLVRSLYPTTHWAWKEFPSRNQANNLKVEVLLTRN